MALGEAVVDWRPTSGGYTPALRGVATLRSGHTVFVKATQHDFVADWLRREHQLYTALAGAPFLPQRVGFLDGPGALPVLLLEDLSAAHWPPAWRPGDVAAVCDTLAAVHRLPLPPGLALSAFAAQAELTSGWSVIAANPGAFLGLELVTPAWLGHALPRLRAAAEAAPLSGGALLHMDVRSDNMCLAAGRGALLIDWNHAVQGDARLDLAFWAPSLRWEGGPPPETVVPGTAAEVGAYAALVSGFFASRAGLPLIPLAPRVREVQRTQLCAALPWAIRALGLPAADGLQADTLCP